MSKQLTKTKKMTREEFLAALIARVNSGVIAAAEAPLLLAAFDKQAETR